MSATRESKCYGRFLLAGCFVLAVSVSSLLSNSNWNCTNRESTTLKLTAQTLHDKIEYTPSFVETYVIDNAHELGYNVSSMAGLKPVCRLWSDATLPFHDALMVYREELANYTATVDALEPIPDLRLSLQTNPKVCDSLDFNLKEIFAQSNLLSFGTLGGMEPILPPMRHPDLCLEGGEHLMKMTYMVHDFGSMCRRLKPTSRIVLVDMGASLQFHGDATQPAMYLTELYRKFGFYFDHIYAFEVTPIPPATVFSKVPAHLQASYHWINVGVESDPSSLLNPLKMLLDNFRHDDFIVIKLDIDTASIELPLAMQLLEDDRYSMLVDQFYFEHHVFLQELASNWGRSMNGSVLESLQLFSKLREKGIAAHSWV